MWSAFSQESAVLIADMEPGLSPRDWCQMREESFRDEETAVWIARSMRMSPASHRSSPLSPPSTYGPASQSSRGGSSPKAGSTKPMSTSTSERLRSVSIVGKTYLRLAVIMQPDRSTRRHPDSHHMNP